MARMSSSLNAEAARLPVAEVAGAVDCALATSGIAVVTAPPGAGKSTLLPLTVLEGLEDGGKVLMLEPRRLAARQVAERMAYLMGEPVGKTVGYRVRFETKVSSQTRIEVLTEGILTRMLVEDPMLNGVSVVIFDEFHERSLNSDLALALVRETAESLRPDLKILIMSATIDASSICASLGAELVESKGRMFPVELKYADADTDEREVAQSVSHTVREAHRNHDGDILAFLPGEADIRRCVELLGPALGDTKVLPLYGLLSFDEQRRAIAPSAPGERKVVLATPIAETSITIEGVRVVVDSGFCRKMVFDPQSGLSHLETVRISRDMAGQRSGRAGRVAPGVCYRLWTRATESRMAENRAPEILEADLSSTVLDISAWGMEEIGKIRWLTPPPQSTVAGAKSLLGLLGALDSDGRITPHGLTLSRIPCHPRIAQMLVKAGCPVMKALASDLAALLEEKDPMSLEENGSDITLRVDELRRRRSQRSLGRSWSRIAAISGQYCRIAGVQEDDGAVDPFAAGALLASAYPERIAKLRPEGIGHFILATAEPAFVQENDTASSFEWTVAASVSARKGGEGRIFLSCPVHPDDLREFARERDNISWDTRSHAVVARHETNVGCLNLYSSPIHSGNREMIDSVICAAAARDGLSMLDFSDDVAGLQRRVAAVASWRPELCLPDLSTESVLARASEWLQPFIGKATTAAELKKIDLCEALLTLLTYEQRQEVERLAPSHLEVPTGSRIRVEYRQGAEAPVLRVRLQECFGLLDTPRVDDGRRPVLMELLSPGFKPVQLTTDLRSFWQTTYFDVRKELRRRYPKHSWPDDPLAAQAVRGTGKR